VAATASVVTAPVLAVAESAPRVISGAADGALLFSQVGGSTHHGAIGSSGAGAQAAALASLAGFLVLLMRGRTRLTDRAAPNSPVFDTDSSPD
jgi:hypothetical protein